MQWWIGTPAISFYITCDQACITGTIISISGCGHRNSPPHTLCTQTYNPTISIIPGSTPGNVDVLGTKQENHELHTPTFTSEYCCEHHIT